jgi:hypothetical protein
MKYGVMLYINTAGTISAEIEEGPDGAAPGAIGSNWQMGPVFGTRGEAEQWVARWRAENETPGWQWVRLADPRPEVLRHTPAR